MLCQDRPCLSVCEDGSCESEITDKELIAIRRTIEPLEYRVDNGPGRAVVHIQLLAVNWHLRSNALFDTAHTPVHAERRIEREDFGLWPPHRHRAPA